MRGYGQMYNLEFAEQGRPYRIFSDKLLGIWKYYIVEDISKFITYVTDNGLVRSNYCIDNYFESIDNVTIENIKEYYLVLLKKCKKNYDNIYKYFQEKKKKRYESTIKITTNDANTLTDGPTIFLTNDVKKVAGVYLKASNIKAEEIDRILKVINKNEKWKKELEKLEMEDDLEKEKNKGSDEYSGINSKLVLWY